MKTFIFSVNLYMLYHMIQRLLMATLVLSLSGQAVAQFVNPLFIPDTLSGSTFNLTVAPSKVQFLPGDSTDTYGINADYLAPTLILNQGDFVQMNVTNGLADTTTMHWHGMHVAAEDDGGPHSVIPPNTTWSPDFTVLDEATTFWYHPHLHHKTAEQVYYGAAGMIIVRDDHEATLDLPRTYGVDDFPLILQDKSFDTTNQLIFTALADTMMVNGTLAPYLEVPAQRVRLRLLNASNQRVYNFRFPPQFNPTVIGGDGGLLESPSPIPLIIMAPGERVEVVLDFTGAAGANFVASCFNSQLPNGTSGGPGGPQGPPGNNLDDSDFDFLEFRVVAATSNPAGPIPTTLNTLTYLDENNADVTRVKVFDTLSTGFPYYINGTAFDMSVINDTIMLDDIEVWEIINETDVAHPFHIHDVQFFILDINGNLPPPHIRAKKDVVLVNVGDTVRFITQFTDFADENIPYMYHCHNLFHEDAGMMGQFIVVDSTVSVMEHSSEAQFRIYPNPVSSVATIERDGFNEDVQIALVDITGKLILNKNMVAGLNAMTLDVSELPSGIYFLALQKQGLPTEVHRLVVE